MEDIMDDIQQASADAQVAGERRRRKSREKENKSAEKLKA